MIARTEMSVGWTGIMAGALIVTVLASADAQDAVSDAVVGAVMQSVVPVTEQGHRRAIGLANGETISALLFEAELDIDDFVEADGFVTSARPVAANRILFRLSNDVYRELDVRLGSFLEVTEQMVQIREARAYAFDGIGDGLAWASEQREIKVKEGFWRRDEQSLGQNARTITAIGLSVGGRAVVFGDITGQSMVLDVGDGRRNAVGQGFKAAVSAAAIADDLSLIALSAGHQLQLFDISDLKQPFAKATLDDRVRDLDIVTGQNQESGLKGQSLMIADWRDGVQLYWIDSTRLALEPITLAGCASPRRVWRHERIVAVHCSDDTVVLFNMETGTLRPMGKLPRVAEDLLLAYPAATSPMVLLMLSNGQFSIVDRRDGQRMLQGVMSREGWIAVDRVGRFDGNGIDPSVLSWSLNSGVEAWSGIQFDQLSRAFRYPGLIGAIFAGKADQLPIPQFDPATDGLPLPLQITDLRFLEKHNRLDKPLQVIATASDVSGHPIQDIHLYHNGRLIEPDYRFIDQTTEQVVDERQKVQVRSVAYQVPPVPGRNVFEVVGEGIGAIRSPKSDDKRAKLVADVVGKHGAGRLHFLGIGVGRFATPQLTLDFPAASVSSVADQFIQRRAGSLAGGEHILLLDQEAHRLSVDNAFARLSKVSRREDTVVVYLSGHGVHQGDRWFFPLANAASLDGLAASNALDHRHLETLLGPINAHNILLLIDACHAGAASGALDVLEMRRHTGQLSERAGIAMIAASRATQEAIEAKALGHGLFSAVIIEGLAGEADLGGDGTVSVFELADYAEEKVALYSRAFLPNPQMPESRRGAYDFALTELRGMRKVIEAATGRQ